MNKFHFSTIQCFQNCPYRFKLRYLDELEVIDDSEADNPLKIGTALHRGQETDLETAIHEYLMSYPVIDDTHITEVMKLEYWIPKVKELLPDGLHEYFMCNDIYEGTMDLLVPCTKHDMNLPNGQFDLYDFKYSNHVHKYMESEQLHVYKYFCEAITGKRIRKMYFVFVPKISIKQRKEETLLDFRKRVMTSLDEREIQIKEVPYKPEKVMEFLTTCIQIQNTTDFPKANGYLCDWCEYKDYCLKGDKTMLLPKAERRQVGKTTKRKLWIYGSAFSGKTTFMDSAPMPLNLNTDGNVQFVTMQSIPIKDTYEGRVKVLAWENFKNVIGELEKTAGQNGFKTIVVDLLEDTYESCRLYMYDRLGITHESDDSFRAWDKVRTEFLSTIRRLMNLDYENIVLISHEDSTSDITKKSGDKITKIKPNLVDKVARKIAGMVDIVARVVVDEDGSRSLNFKADEVVFGGGRLKGINTTKIDLKWDALVKVYDEANNSVMGRSEATEAPQTNDNTEGEEDTGKGAEEVPVKRRRTRRGAEEVPEEKKDETVEEQEEQEEPEEEEIPFLPDHYYYIPDERNVVKVTEGEAVPAEWRKIEEKVFQRAVSMIAKGEDIGILFGDEKKPEEEEKPTRRRRTRKVREQ